MLGLDDVLHWELRQSLEAYMGFVLLVALSDNLPADTQLKITDLLITVGISVYRIAPAEGIMELRIPEYSKHHQNWHLECGLAVNRLCITDRWGKYREFDDTGTRLIARPCHRNKERGCPEALAFLGCGCACPYMHARHFRLANWMMNKCRDSTTENLSGWPLDVAHKTRAGEVRLVDLPYVEGTVMLPSEWRAEHKRQNETRCQCLDAFSEETLAKVASVRTEVEEAFQASRLAW